MGSKTMTRYFVVGTFVLGFGLGWAVKGGDSAVEDRRLEVDPILRTGFRHS